MSRNCRQRHSSSPATTRRHAWRGAVWLGLAGQVVTDPAPRRCPDAYTTDEVHVHGYDLSAPVGPDRSTTLDFVAHIPGTFDVELEQAGLSLFELTVR